jgi:hypothetical protein
MNYLALKGEVSDFSKKNLSLDRKLSILRGFIPRNLCSGKRIRPKGRGITPALSNKICREWQRKNFQDLPDELSKYRNPRSKASAEAGAMAPVQYLAKAIEENSARTQTKAF